MKALGGGRAKVADPLEVMSDFLAFVREETLSDRERDIVTRGLDDLRQAEETA